MSLCLLNLEPKSFIQKKNFFSSIKWAATQLIFQNWKLGVANSKNWEDNGFKKGQFPQV